MDELFEVFSKKPKFTIKGDFVDSLHSKRTVVIFLAFAVLVAIKQFDEDRGALACWLLGSLSDEQVDYVHQLCWVNSTYYFPGLEDPDDFHHERRFAIPYYQFILFILVGQAFAFYLPNLLWNYMASDSASYVSSVLEHIDLVKHWSTLVEKEKEHAEKMAKKQEKHKLKRLIKRTVDDTMSSSKKSSQVDVSQEPGVSRKPASRKHSKEDVPQQRVGLSSADTEKSALIANAKTSSDDNDDDSESENLQPLSQLLPILEQETFSELQESLVPISHMRSGFRARRKEQIDTSRALMRQRAAAAAERDRSPVSALRSTTRQEETEPEDKRKMLKQSRQKLRKLIRRPVDAVRNLTTYYLLYKLVNLANILVQFFLLTFIFGNDFYTFGIQFINRVFVHPETTLFSTKQFPILTFCDFFVYQNLRQTHFNTAQCLLHINVYIEKFYIVIWFWLVLLFFVTLFNLISWIIEIFVSSTGFLIKYITIKEKILNSSGDASANSTQDPKKFEMQVKNFKQNFLGHDGILMMQMIKNISGPIWFMDILYNAWTNWSHQFEQKVQLES